MTKVSCSIAGQHGSPVVYLESCDCQVINSASGRCWSSDTYNPCPGVMEGVPSNNEYQGGFGTPLMTKVSRCQSAIAHDM